MVVLSCEVEGKATMLLVSLYINKHHFREDFHVTLTRVAFFKCANKVTMRNSLSESPATSTVHGKNTVYSLPGLHVSLNCFRSTTEELTSRWPKTSPGEKSVHV